MNSVAFGSLRVTESLRALKTYLDHAAQLAGAIPPADVVPVGNQPGTPAQSPRITSVTWDKTGTRKISLPDSSTVNGVTTLDLTVTGVNLDDPETLKLVGAGPGKPYFETGIFSNPSSTSFTATIDIVEPSEGAYDVKLENEDGQTFILSRACRIKAAPAGYSLGRSGRGARKALAAKKRALPAKKKAAARKRSRTGPRPPAPGAPPLLTGKTP